MSILRQPERARRWFELACYLLGGIVIALVVFVRLRLLAVPLERDEGEYAYAGQLLLHGVPPYRLACNMKFPGAYASYALAMALFGQTPAGIHFALLLINLATCALVFVLALRLTNAAAPAVAAAAAYGVMSASPAMLGLAAHVEHFVLLPMLAGLVLLIRARPKLLLAGICFGLAILMKQPAMFFAVAAAIFLIFREVRSGAPAREWSKRAAVFCLGVVAPVALTFALLAFAGVFPKFWFWTIQYAAAYGNVVPFREGMLIARNMSPHVFADIWPFMLIAIGGCIALITKIDMRKHAALLAVFAAASVAALSSGFYFREHYFLLVLPLSALLIAVAVQSSRGLAVRVALLAFLTIALLFPFVRQSRVLFALSPDGVCRTIYPGNLFADAPRIGQYIREQTSESDKIAVVGSEPEIYFYARRQSATSYIYTYALMEEQPYAQRMQEEMEREIETGRPKMLVVISLQMSWHIADWSDLSIFDWLQTFVPQNYSRVGFVNVGAAPESEFCVPCPRPPDAASPPSLLLLQRKATLP